MNASDLLKNTGSKFDDPFILPSSSSFPTDIKGSLNFCTHLWGLNPLYAQATNRVFGYFNTSLSVVGNDQGDSRQRSDLLGVLNNDLKIPVTISTIGSNWGAYGNSFLRFHRAFDRYYVVEAEGGSRKLVSSSQIPSRFVTFKPATNKFTIPNVLNNSVSDLGSKGTIDCDYMDLKSDDVKRCSIQFLDPRYVDIDSSHFSGASRIAYRFPEDVVSRIKDGCLHEVANTPKSMLAAIVANKDYLFNEGEVFHFRNPGLVCLERSGWATPTLLLHYRNIHQIQVYRKIDEAIGLDYLHPFRVFSPEAGSSSDITQNLLLSSWKNEVAKMVRSRRKDKTAFHAMPFSLKYDEFGASGKQYAPKELLDLCNQQLLDAVGYPQELLRGSLSVQQMPTAIRLMESSYKWLVTELNSYVRWVTSKVEQYQSSGLMVELVPPSLADDIETRMHLLNLTAAGEISRERGYKSLHISDPVDEIAKRQEEDQDIQRTISEKTKEFETEMTSGSMAETVAADQASAQEAQAAGGMPPGAAGPPAAGGGGAGMQDDYSPNAGETPMDLDARGAAIAEMLIMNMEDGPRRSELMRIKSVHPTLHSVVSQKMKEIRAAGASQGRANVAQTLAGQ